MGIVDSQTVKHIQNEITIAFIGTKKMKPQIQPQTPPAQLWIGQSNALAAQATTMLQETFCSKNGCKQCHTCNQIEYRQHHNAIWLYPEKQYTLDQLGVIFNSIAFKLDENEQMFFILQKADFLSDACSNSLLKSVEEPPPGYHFLFLAERLSQILPTIQSRCIIKNFYSDHETGHHQQLIEIFKSNTRCVPSYFLKILDEEKPNERDSIEILDCLFTYWLQQEKTALANNEKDNYKKAQFVVAQIKQSLQKPPMPGSSKIFWRNFYLQFSRA